MKATVEDARLDELSLKRDARGSLAVLEFGKSVPFNVVRLFYVSGVPAGETRGGHAHLRCRQYLICQAGRLEVKLADGVNERSIELSGGQALFVEAGIFAAQTYLDDSSTLLVLCDRPYEADDYVHGMEAFLKYRHGEA